jgi:hypothetical protein
VRWFETGVWRDRKDKKLSEGRGSTLVGTNNVNNDFSETPTVVRRPTEPSPLHMQRSEPVVSPDRRSPTSERARLLRVDSTHTYIHPGTGEIRVQRAMVSR